MLNSFLMQRSLLFLTLAVLRGEKWVLQVLLLALMVRIAGIYLLGGVLMHLKVLHGCER